MAKPKVFVTRLLPQPAMDKLAQFCEVEVNPFDRQLTRDELLAGVAGKDAVLCLLTDTIDDAVLAAAGPNCKIFANYAVGFNNIDVAAAKARGILISNTPGVLTDATADLAWALLFSAARRVPEAERFIRAGKYEAWAPQLFLGQDITGATLGVIGAGRIGDAFARKSVGFSMKVLYYDVTDNKALEDDIGAERVDLDTLLQQADFISVHVPLLPDTQHLISDREFGLMKNTAVFINSARGPIVDEKALVRALQNKTIFAAGLDVTEQEPAFEPELAQLDNVVFLPHIASATIRTRTLMGVMAVENILAALDGETPPNAV